MLAYPKPTLCLHEEISRTVRVSEVQPSRVQLKRITNLPTVISRPCRNTLINVITIFFLKLSHGGFLIIAIVVKLGLTPQGRSHKPFWIPI